MADLYLDDVDVFRRLAAACKAAGSQKAWAEKHGLSAPYVSDVLHKRREPGPTLLDALGLVRVVRYRAKAVTAKGGSHG